MKTMRILCLVLVVAVILGLSHGTAAANNKNKVTDPTWDKYKVPEKEADLQTVPVIFALVALIGVGVVAFKSAHRTHLD